MKCLVFDRGDGVIGLGLKIQFGGVDQFSIVWPDRPPERMTEDFLKSNGIKILGESELSPPMDPPLVQNEDPVAPVEPFAGTAVDVLVADGEGVNTAPVSETSTVKSEGAPLVADLPTIPPVIDGKGVQESIPSSQTNSPIELV